MDGRRREMTWTSRYVLLAIGLGLAGCGVRGGIRHAINHYNSGEYEEAKQVWIDLETRDKGMPLKARVRYLVFRGLTHWRLGEVVAARYYLYWGLVAYEEAGEEWIPAENLAEMREALQQLGLSRP
jgi:hypothetical protein